MKDKSVILVLIALLSCITGMGYLCYILYNLVKHQTIYVNMISSSFLVLGCFIGMGIMFLWRTKHDKNCN